MKPIKLELKYIGPYQNETINFEDINHTLFLISGKTGSGKSMIFDAITHALFATASTNARGTESLRSQFAPSTEPSIIEFTFNFRGVVYRVERRLRYFRGTNTTETPPESSIYDEMGQLIESGLTKVTSFITELLQLDAVQFRQIGLLPQGEFRKFLVASSSDKEQILKALFRTERFNSLYQKLKIEHDEEKKQLDYKHQFILNEFKNVLTEEFVTPSFKDNMSLFVNKIKEKNTLFEEKNKQREQYKKELDERLQEIQNIETNNKLIESYKKEQNELEEILKQESVIKEKEKQLETYLKAITIEDSYIESRKYKQLVQESEDALTDISTKLEKKEKLHKNSVRELDKLLKNEEEIESYRKRIKELAKFDTEEYEKIQSEITYKNEKLTTLKNELKQYDEEIIRIESRLSKIKVDSDALVLLQERLFDEKNKKETLKREFEAAEKYMKYQQDIIELDNKMMSLSAERDKIEIEIKDQNTELESLQGLDIKNINEMIAHLEVGAPCILCQQTVSKIPDTIQFDAELYTTLDQLNREIKSLETKRSVLNDYGWEETREPHLIEKEMEEANKKTKELQNELEMTQLEIKKKQELNDKHIAKKEGVQKLNNQFDILTHELKALIMRFDNFKEETGFDDFHAFKKSYKEMDTAVEGFNIQRKTLESDINEEKLALTKLKSSLESARYKRDTEHNILDTHQRKVYTFIESNPEIDMTVLESLFSIDGESLKEEIDSYYQAMRDKESVLKSIRSQISSFEIIDLTERNEAQKELSETIETLSKEIGQLEYETKSLSQKQEKLEEQIKEYEQTEESFTKLVKFVELLNGKHGNPTLSRFVLVYYLEMILAQANIRLRKMTNGRYELCRAESYRSDQSLHIDVFDYFNNARRSVATLSGGESFQAALALALALSEIIQHEAGSIEMDMLLIDEGFGTLDEETLKIAIDTLFDLQKTGKMIGIISHVEELKTMLGNILYVETQDERSKTRLVTPLSN